MEQIVMVLGEAVVQAVAVELKLELTLVLLLQQD